MELRLEWELGMGRTRGCPRRRALWAEGTVSARVLRQRLGEEHVFGAWEGEEQREVRMQKQRGLDHLYPVGCGKEFGVLFCFLVEHHLMGL